MKLSAWIGALALSAGLCTSSFGQITGTVTLSGKPPEMKEITLVKVVPGCQHKDPVYEETVVTGDKGQLANVVVLLKLPAGKTYPPPSQPAVLDQKGCIYTPHVVALMTGQTLDVKNSDKSLHNVHTLSLDNDPMNFAMPTVGTKPVKAFKTVETFKVKCDVHPWMFAWIRVLDNPFFAVTSADEKNIGTYSIDTKGLADGEYEIVFWQEKYGEKTAKVNVKDGKGHADFTFSADQKAQANPAPQAKDVRLASLTKDKDCDGSCCDVTTEKAKSVASAK